MHEILTLQLGHRANHLATHFWNTQESYFTYDDTQTPSLVDHDVLFRPGIGTRGEDTFTPRTLIYDLKGGFGSLRKWGGLYDQQHMNDGHSSDGAPKIWNGSVVLHTDPQIQQSEYQRSLNANATTLGALSTGTVRYWSDFNRVFYHPRSLIQINDYELNSALLPFEKWESGEDLFASMDRDADLLDRDVRVLAEECDQMQGIQIFTGSDDAWGGFASKYVESLRDEYGKSSIWAWGIEEPQGRGSRAKQLLRAVNSARTINELATQVSMFIPMSVPSSSLPSYVHLDRNSQWQTSALLEVALESITLPSRLRPGTQTGGTLGGLETALNVNGNQRLAQIEYSILAAQSKVFPVNNDNEDADHRVPSSTVITMLMKEDSEGTKSHFDIDLSDRDLVSSSLSSRQRRRSEHTFGAVEILRGRNQDPAGEDVNHEEVIHRRQRKRFAGLTVVERYHSPLEFPLLDSFPELFTFQRESEGLTMQSSLSTTSRISCHIKSLQKIVNYSALLDEREALYNGLGEIAEAYEDGWDGGSDEDSD